MSAKFRCFDDCKAEGCPTHEIDVKRQNSVMLLHFSEDGQDNLLIPEDKFVAMIKAYFTRYGEPHCSHSYARTDARNSCVWCVATSINNS
jgi:predicted nucleotidyltransferase